MLINFNQLLTDLEGNPINGVDKFVVAEKDVQGNLKPVKIDGEEVFITKQNDSKLTLKQSCATALIKFSEGNEDAFIERFELARKISASAEPLEIDAKKITLILQAVHKLNNVLVYGRCYELLNMK